MIKIIGTKEYRWLHKTVIDKTLEIRQLRAELDKEIRDYDTELLELREEIESRNDLLKVVGDLIKEVDSEGGKLGPARWSLFKMKILSVISKSEARG